MVVGTSVGAINGAFVAADPAGAAERLARLWRAIRCGQAFSETLWGRAVRLARSGTHLHSIEPLRHMLDDSFPGRLRRLELPFHCVAASIERARARWFSSGPIVPAVLASCAVPGLLPPVEIDGEHFFDGGLVHSIPVGRAVALGARTVYVLHVGRIERPLTVPRRPGRWDWWRSRSPAGTGFIEEMSALPGNVRVHTTARGHRPRRAGIIPSSGTATETKVAESIERAYTASASYLAQLTRT